MSNNRDGLMAHRYTESVEVRLLKANAEPIKSKADYRYVKLGVEIFPIHIDMVEIYNDSNRSFKRGIKKKYIKMLKKLRKQSNE